MQISVALRIGRDEEVMRLEVGKHMEVADLKGMIEGDSSIPANRQLIYHRNKILNDNTQTLESVGITDEDILVVHEFISESQARAAQVLSSQQAGTRARDDAETLRQSALSDPSIIQQLRLRRPELAEEVYDEQRFREVWNGLLRRQNEAERERERNIQELNNGPIDEETQKKIEEMIREGQVMENLEDAFQFTPEIFARVHMLYVPVEVNNVKVKAFVDSGAQTTIMSPACAERCGIMRLLDKRFSGVARGVGTAKILGRVHKSQIKIGHNYFMCSFTVMEGKDVDLLLGLDMLKRHQATIDLRKGALVIEDSEVPFLGEADIPKNEEIFAGEPTIEGPGGMQVGGRSGTLMPPATEQPNAHGSTSMNFQGRGQIVGASASTPQRLQQSPQAPPQQQTQPRAAQPASARPGQQSATSFPPAAITHLMGMGFQRDEVIQALQQAGGNVNIAGAILYGADG